MPLGHRVDDSDCQRDLARIDAAVFDNDDNLWLEGDAAG